MMKMQKENHSTIILGFAAAAVIVALASVHACRAVPFGINDLATVTITPANPVMAGGTQLQLTATGVHADGSTEDLTAAVHWASSNSMVSISDTGLASAAPVSVSQKCTIFATVPGGISGSVSLHVENATVTAIAVSPSTGEIDGGITIVLAAIGTFVSASDTFQQDITSMATWSSSNEAIASVDAGQVLGVTGGTALITASWEGILSNDAAITVSGKTLVSIDIDPKNITLDLMMQGRFYHATAIFDDASQRDITQLVTWTSSDPKIAWIAGYSKSVGAEFISTGHLPGTVIITARLGAISGTTSLTSLALSPY